MMLNWFATFISRIFLLLMQHNKAELISRRVLLKSPSYAPAWHVLGNCLAFRARLNEKIEASALSAKQTAYRYAPNKYTYIKSLVCYLGYLHQVGQAEQVVNESQSRIPGKQYLQLIEILSFYKQYGSTREDI